MSKYDNDKNKPVLDWIKTDLLLIDNSYQRSVEGKRSQNTIKLIIDNFDWNEFAPLVVAKTPEGYNVIDGQHRFIAASRLKIEKLPCWIIQQSDVNTQADTFVGINKNRVAVNSYALYKAKLAKNDELAKKVEEFCYNNDIKIPASGYVSKPNHTLALYTISKQIKKHNGAYLAEAIRLIKESFPTSVGQIKPDIIDTLVKLKQEYGSKIKDSEIIAAMRNFGDNKMISAKAKQLKSLDNTIKNLQDAHFRVFCAKIKEIRRSNKNG
jgi:hypothetical protein